MAEAQYTYMYLDNTLKWSQQAKTLIEDRIIIIIIRKKKKKYAKQKGQVSQTVRSTGGKHNQVLYHKLKTFYLKQ